MRAPGGRVRPLRLAVALVALLAIVYVLSSGVKKDADIQAEFGTPAGDATRTAGSAR